MKDKFFLKKVKSSFSVFAFDTDGSFSLSLQAKNIILEQLCVGIYMAGPPQTLQQLVKTLVTRLWCKNENSIIENLKVLDLMKAKYKP